jgi:hypothetical protein
MRPVYGGITSMTDVRSILDEEARRPKHEKCGGPLFKCQNHYGHVISTTVSADSIDAALEEAAVTLDALTYCPACDECSLCSYHMSPVKGQQRTTLPHLEVWLDGQEGGNRWRATIDGREIGLQELYTFLERIVPPPVLVVAPPVDISDEKRRELVNKLIEAAKRPVAYVGPVVTQVEPLLPPYKWLTFDEWLTAINLTSDPDANIMRTTWQAAREEVGRAGQRRVEWNGWKEWYRSEEGQAARERFHETYEYDAWNAMNDYAQAVWEAALNGRPPQPLVPSDE